MPRTAQPNVIPVAQLLCLSLREVRAMACVSRLYACLCVTRPRPQATHRTARRSGPARVRRDVLRRAARRRPRRHLGLELVRCALRLAYRRRVRFDRVWE
mmetsp:Transcript_27621/g.110606  ORF Transcript_27621/g.110606 Transcript_27621/m.110606 type:complete len:100 (+) Transcript_27621:90-389(+)